MTDSPAAAPTAPEPTAPEPTAAKPSRLARAALTGFGLLCVVSPVASAAYFWTRHTPPAASHEAPKPAHPAPAAGLFPIDTTDDLIRAGAFAEALPICRRQRPELPAPKRRALAYREALCLEALGRFPEADAAYRVATPPEGDRAAWARAELGRARCALATGDLNAAERTVARVALGSGHPDCTGTHVAGECAFLRARVEAARSGPEHPMDPLDAEAVAWPELAGGFDLYPDWLRPDTAPAPSAGLPAGPSTLEVRRSPAGLTVTAHDAERPVAEWIRALAAAAGLRIEMPAPPKATPQGARSGPATLPEEKVALDVQAMPLDDILSALLCGSGIGWKLEENVLSFAPSAPKPDAESAIKRALAAAPKHPRALAMRVWLANLALAAGRTREAAKAYEEVVERSPSAAESAHAGYNLGLVELRESSLASARSRFVSVADRTPRSRWADYGWWWAGRTHLDAGDAAAARKAFRTALAGRTREVASAVALGLCTCDLLDGHAEAARAALESHRVAPRERHRVVWDALERVLLYRASPSDGRREALLTALTAAGDARALGPGGALLAGRLYRELGLPDRAAALYDAVSVRTRGPLALRMTFDAAAWYDLSERPAAARQRYLAVAATDPKGLGPQAELRLAGMALRAGDADECLRRCRALIGRPGVERNEVLSLMGCGYEAKRNHRYAAECFGGRLPPE